MPLRFSFLKSIFVDGMSVKNVNRCLNKAALKWKMHYSTAKIIARTARREKQIDVIQKISIRPEPEKECSWREMVPEIPHPKASYQKERDQGTEDNSEGISENKKSSLNQKVEIISTIGWTYEVPESAPKK